MHMLQSSFEVTISRMAINSVKNPFCRDLLVRALLIDNF